MRESYIELRGLRFCVCDWGPYDGPRVVVLHGWLDQAAAWSPVAASLASEGYRIIAPDHRGHGRSQHGARSGYHFTEYIADLDALLDVLGGKPVVLVGHSMGASIAVLYAGLRPHMVSHLVLVDGIGPNHSPPADAADQLRTFLDHQKKDWQHRTMADLDEASEKLRRFNKGLKPEQARKLARRTTCEQDGGLIWTWDPWHRSRSAVAFDGARFAACLTLIEAPTTAIFGIDSWYGALDVVPERLALIRDFKQRINLKGGHNLHVEAPDALAAHIMEAIAAR
jgi:pimeloyl-ACP methyl ester carboxylesterase